MTNYKKYIILLALIFTGQWAMAQQPPVVEQDTSKKSNKVIVDHADLGEYIQEDGIVTQRLSSQNRQVEIRQGDMFMYCDTAIIIENDVTAFGNVIIQQGDTMSIFADSLVYDGEFRIADLFGEVALDNSGQKLFTDRLKYDMNTRIATYTTGAVLTNDTTQLVSKKGYYDVSTNDAFFKDSVSIIDEELNLRTDTLKYNTKTRIATFLGPTRINQEEARIYCEGGFYDTRNKKAQFEKNAQYINKEQQATAKVIRYNGERKEVTMEGDVEYLEGKKRATADKMIYEEETKVSTLSGNAYFDNDGEIIVADEIRYDSESEDFETTGRSTLSDPPFLLFADRIDYDGTIGHALGHVVWQDTSDHTQVICEQADYNKDTDYLLASGGRPLLIRLISDDSLFMRSDTLISFKEDPADSARTLLAYPKVKIFKSDLQAVCDSVSYSTADSLFQFFDNPVIWSDSTQFTADTIQMLLSNNEIDRIFLFNQSFINNTEDEVFFNQIKGRDITAFFREEALHHMLVEGNAESVYYALDEEKAYLGVNKTICSRMLISFSESKLTDIRFFIEPKGNFFPMRPTDHEGLKLEGFRWEMARRPLSKLSL